LPLYEFVCRKCGEEFTTRMSMSEREQAKCPQCASDQLKQKWGGNFIVGGGRGCEYPPRGGFS